MERQGPKQRISAFLPGSLMQALEQRAAREGRSVSELAEALLEEHVRGVERQPGG